MLVASCMYKKKNPIKELFKYIIITMPAIQMIALQGMQLQLHLLAFTVLNSWAQSLVGTDCRESKTRFTILHCNHTKNTVLGVILPLDCITIVGPKTPS